MKNLFLVLILLFAFALPVEAKNESGPLNPDSVQQQAGEPPLLIEDSEQNQVETQNWGDDMQLRVTTQEQENLREEEGLKTRNQVAVQNMNIVAQRVQEMLQIRTEGGIGDQVKLVAREQNQAQFQIQEQLNKVDSRNGVAKVIMGPDFAAIKNLRQEIEQNEVRIQQLEQLQNQLENEEDAITIQESIKALIQENIALQELVKLEEQTRSIFGWLFKLFAY